MTARTVAITGAYGYLGGVIRRGLAAADWRTLALVRSPRGDDHDAMPYDLGAGIDAALLDGVDALVHCAYDLRLVSRSDIWRVNVGGTDRLLAAAQQAGVRRIVVISSIAAYPGTRQVYGLAKLVIEDSARRHGAVVVRPGLVYGPNAGGMVGSLRRMVALPAVPLMAGHSYQYTVHEDDLGAAVLALVAGDRAPAEPVVVASAASVTVADLISGIAAAQGRRPRLVPVPWRPMYWALRGAEGMHVRLPFRADSLWGLAHPAPRPDPAALDALGITVRRFEATPALG